MTSSAVKMLSGDLAWQMLVSGNLRFAVSGLTHPHQTAGRRAEVSSEQQPFAIILGCADSRVPPEVIFDQGIGDLFVIRVAGNIVDDVVLGSIEYAAEYLHPPLVMVLSHSRCAAVSAAASETELVGHLPSLAKTIAPAVARAKNEPGDLVVNAIRFNALMMAEQLKSSEPVLAPLVEAGKLKVVAAHYDMDSGKVSLLKWA